MVIMLRSSSCIVLQSNSHSNSESMSFFVPEQHAGLYDEVTQRFRLLIRKQVISTIDEIDFDNWLSNFVTEEDQYLAARLLDGLMFRSTAMINSSIDQLLQCILPGKLRSWGAYSHSSIEDYLSSLEAGNSNSPVRFVAIDHTYPNEEPGKSGSVLIRHFRRHALISKNLTCRPEAIASLPETVKVLVFVDDIVGSGKQFGKFAKYHKLAEQTGVRNLIYCPLIAYQGGLETIARDQPWLTLSPVEVLNSKHCFYCPNTDNPILWAADEENLVDDVRGHVNQLASANGIPATTKFSLDLLVGFEHSTPNNTIPLLWARSNNWHPLFNR